MMRRIAVLMASVGCVVSLSACSALDVKTLPAPGKTYGDGYDVVMEFDNVLNLPARAKVTLNGRAVGIVTGVAIGDGRVNVTSRIDRSVEIPANASAALQQATVLGDMYIALEPPAGDAAPPIQPGGHIPLPQTISPPQLEDTIARMANFVGSGAIQRVQNTILGLNRVTPPRSQLRGLTTQFVENLADVSNNIDTVDTMLNSVAHTAEVLRKQLPKIEYGFSPEGMRGFDYSMQIAGFIGINLPSIGSVYSGGYWLVPLMKSMANATQALQQSKWAFEDEVPKWRDLFTNSFLPQQKYPAINITSIVGPDGRELLGNVQDVLRILGAAP